MALEAVFERFTKKSPLTVMARLLLFFPILTIGFWGFAISFLIFGELWLLSLCLGRTPCLA